MTDVALGAGGATRYAGSRVHRVEDPRLLTGHGTYVDDVSPPGMLHACFVRSPHPRARIVGIDTSEALALHGVQAVFVAGDLNPGVHEQWHSMFGPDGPETPRPPLAEDEVRFAGDPVVLVVAESRYIAEDACDLVVVDYEEQPAVVDYTTAESSGVLVHERHGSNLIGEMAGPPASALEDVVRLRRPRGARHHLPAGAGGGADGDTRDRRAALATGRSRSGRPPRRRTRCGRSAPACWGCPSTGSGSS